MTENQITVAEALNEVDAVIPAYPRHIPQPYKDLADAVRAELAVRVNLTLTERSTAPSRIVVEAIASLVDYNWSDEEDDYNHEAMAEDNSREGHIFESIMLIQRWLEAAHGHPHVEPRIVPDDRETGD